jgi:hypothetical protein
LDVPGPPVVVDDLVFALGHFIEGAVNSYLLALDLKTGHLRYSVPLVIGQQELSMFNMPFQEFTTGIPVFGDGMILCPTNLGLTAAVDVAMGDLRWLSAYQAVPIEPPPNYYKNRPRSVWWYNSPPVVKDHRLFITPHDSRRIHAFDTATGKLLWEEVVALSSWRSSHEAPNCFFLGIQNDRAIVVQEDRVQALDVKTGRIEWDSELGSRDVLGRGALTDEHVYLPTDRDLLVLDAEGRESGTHVWPEENFHRYGSVAGNLLVFPDLLVTATSHRIGVAFDPGEVLRTLLERVRAEGATFQDLARIGNLYRRKGMLPEAAESLEKCLLQATQESVRQADVGRVRLGLCRSLRSLSIELLEAGRREEALASLVRAEPFADDLDTRLPLTLDMLEHFGSDPGHREARLWLQELRQRFGQQRARFEKIASHEVTVGIFVSLELASRYRQTGEVSLALDELQRLHVEYPVEVLGDQTSTELARLQIDELLAQATPELRAQFDRNAEEEFRSAESEGDVDRLGLLLKRYPNASKAPHYSAVYCTLLRQSGRCGPVLQAGIEVLRQELAQAPQRAILAEMSRAAQELGNQSLARGLVAVLQRRFPEDGVPADLQELLGPPQGPDLPLPTGGPEKVKEIAVERGCQLIGGGSISLHGEPLENSLSGFLLVKNYRVLKALDLDLNPLWETDLSDFRVDGYQLRMCHVAGAIIVRCRRTLVALDIRNGSLLWTLRFERPTQGMEQVSGLLFVMEEQPGMHEDERPILVLTAMEPRTGVVVWRSPVVGPSLMYLRTEEDVVTVVSGPKPRQVEAFSAFTGERLLHPHPVAVRNSETRYLPDLNLIIIPEQSSLSSPMEAFNVVGRLAAYNLTDESLRWEFDLAPLEGRLEGVFKLGHDLVVVGGFSERQMVMLDPATGKRTQDPMIFPQRFKQAQLAVDKQRPEERTLLLQDNRIVPTEGLALYAVDGDGRPLFQTYVPMPADTIRAEPPKSVLRRGDYLLLTMPRFLPGENITDLVTLHAASGSLVDRQSFRRRSHSKIAELLSVADSLILRIEEKLYLLRWN